MLGFSAHQHSCGAPLGELRSSLPHLLLYSKLRQTLLEVLRRRSGEYLLVFWRIRPVLQEGCWVTAVRGHRAWWLAAAPTLGLCEALLDMDPTPSPQLPKANQQRLQSLTLLPKAGVQPTSNAYYPSSARFIHILDSNSVLRTSS